MPWVITNDTAAEREPTVATSSALPSNVSDVAFETLADDMPDGRTMKLFGDDTVTLPAVTATGPDFAFCGTVVVRALLDTVTTEAAVPLNPTVFVVVELPKPLPTMVTMSPGVPNPGRTSSTASAVAAASWMATILPDRS